MRNDFPLVNLFYVGKKLSERVKDTHTALVLS